MTNEIKKCDFCDRNFEKTHYKQRFCAKECHKLSLKIVSEIETKICKNCSKKFKPHMFAQKRQEFCTTECRKEYNTEIRECKTCSKEFKTCRENIFYCSDECRKVNYNVLSRGCETKKINLKLVAMINCASCGKKFETTGIAKLCSNECRIKNRKVKLKLNEKKSKTKKCEFCKKEFVSRIYNKITCSTECKEQLHFLKNKIIKNCKFCKKEFESAKGYKLNRKTCSEECRFKLMGLANKGNRWKQSEEAKKKISIGRIKFLSIPENLKKHANYVKESWKDEKIRASRLTEERALKISKTGKRLYRLGLKKVPINEKYGKLTKYKGYTFRSTWEAKVAKWLDEKNIKWEYESNKCYHVLQDGSGYIVDFYLPELDKFLEVKGWWDEKSILKCDDFIMNKGHNSLIIVDSKNIDDISLRYCYSDQSKAYYEYQDRMMDAQIDYYNGAFEQ